VPDESFSERLTASAARLKGRVPGAAAQIEAIVRDSDEASDARAVASEPFPDEITFEVEGNIFEVLERFGLAHFRTPDGIIYGVARRTPGVDFAQLQEGTRVRCEVTDKYHRVLRAKVVA
jgi:hypothetical protein